MSSHLITYHLSESAPRTLPVDEGETLLAAPLAQAIRMRFGCKMARCGRCMVRVLEGAEHLAEPTADEVRKLGPEHLRAGFRLACQAKAHGAATVQQAADNRSKISLPKPS